MAIPYRGNTSEATYFVSANCAEKRFLLQSDRSAGLLIDVMLHYRAEGNYLLHEFVVMPNHFHVLLTPAGITLERTMQLIKGGFSYRLSHELGIRRSPWQTSFVDRRVRDFEEYRRFREYIRQNPVKARLVSRPEDWKFGSAGGSYPLDEVPQRLKPEILYCP
jgi:putative transposase